MNFKLAKNFFALGLFSLIITLSSSLSLVQAQATTPAYVINFDAAAPSSTVINVIDAQNATVTGR